MPEDRQQHSGNEHFVIVFDGGSKGNPGKGYGSFHISGPDDFVIHERREYGDRVTNNVAEYQTLIAALDRLRAELGEGVTRTSLQVLGDSQLVINQTNGVWKVKKSWLMPLRDEVIDLLDGFGSYALTWQPRGESVRVLGH